MKLPSDGGIITVFGNQEEARRCEDNASIGNKNVHVIETPNEDNEAANNEEPEKAGGVSPAEHTKTYLLGPLRTCEGSVERSSSMNSG